MSIQFFRVYFTYRENGRIFGNMHGYWAKNEKSARSLLRDHFELAGWSRRDVKIDRVMDEEDFKEMINNGGAV